MANKKGIGILTFALNSDTVDYERCAHLMALSYRATNKHPLPMAVVVNTLEGCRPQLKELYDHVIVKSDMPVVNPMHHEAKLFRYTPFAETIKVECDMLFTIDINHWIKNFRLYDVCFTNQVYNFANEPADDSYYRKYIKENCLPNCYNGLMYVRYCKTSVDYFREIDEIFKNWDEEKRKYRKFDRYGPSTDFAMAMACHKMDDLNFAVNSTGFPGFIHAKPFITHRSESQWHTTMKWSLPNAQTFIVNGIKAEWPVHYYDKKFCTEELIAQYEHYL